MTAATLEALLADKRTAPLQCRSCGAFPFEHPRSIGRNSGGEEVTCHGRNGYHRSGSWFIRHRMFGKAHRARLSVYYKHYYRREKPDA